MNYYLIFSDPVVINFKSYIHLSEKRKKIILIILYSFKKIYKNKKIIKNGKLALKKYFMLKWPLFRDQLWLNNIIY